MLRNHKKARIWGWILGGWAMMQVPNAQANPGVFNLPRFVEPGKFAVGVEPELTLTSGAGIAVNARYTHGISDLNNVYGILGTGSGPRKFRAGAGMTFDFFPDIENQPGIGIALQGLYIRVPKPDRPEGNEDTVGQVELTTIPYIHKAFQTPATELEPFLAVPLGLAFESGRYRAISSLVLGTMFKTNEKVRTSMEVGIKINRTESYIAAGVTYYH